MDNAVSSASRKYGAALTAVALGGTPASAAIVNLGITPGSVPFNTVDLIVLDDGGIAVGTFFQLNTYTTSSDGVSSGYYRSFGSPGIYTTVPNSINRFVPGPLVSGSPISSGNATDNHVFVPSFVAGVYTFGFMTPANQPGWIRISFAPVPGAITYLAAAYNNTPGSTILAGEVALVPESSTVIALAGLATLASGVGARGLRRRKAARRENEVAGS